MATTQPATLDPESRYKDTNILSNIPSGKYRFEMWERPAELANMTLNSTRYIVHQHELGRLDLLAWNFYDNVKLWWIIAAVNDIVNPLTDMYEGQILIIPDRNDVLAFVSRPGQIVDETKG
jgi:hypothetical protein